MELVEAGTLMTFLKYRELKFDPLTDEECSCIMRQILSGIEHIHELHIIHRDIKPQNILLRSFTKLEGAVKIADFGLGIQNEYSRDNAGTILYMAPEQLTENKYNKVNNSINNIGS